MRETMDKEGIYALNDILDAVEELASIVRELNPGATEQIRRVKYFLDRADRSIKDIRETAGLS
jgi:hypothetical protein